MTHYTYRYLFLTFITIMSFACFNEGEEFIPYERTHINSPLLLECANIDGNDIVKPHNPISILLGRESHSFSGNNFYFPTAQVEKDRGSIAHLAQEGYFNVLKHIPAYGTSTDFIKTIFTPKKYSVALPEMENNVLKFNKLIVYVSGASLKKQTTFSGMYVSLKDTFFYNRISGTNKGERTNGTEVSIVPIGFFILDGSYEEISFSSPLQFEINLKEYDIQSIESKQILWKLDTIEAKYKEVGVANVEEHVLKGSLTSGGCFLVGTPYPIITFSGKFVTTIAGVKYPLQDRLLRLAIDDHFYLETNTTSSGFFSFFAPQNVPMELEVYNHCREVQFSTPVPEMFEDVEMPDQDIPGKYGSMSFSVKNCKGVLEDALFARESNAPFSPFLSIQDDRGIIDVIATPCGVENKVVSVEILPMEKSFVPPLFFVEDEHLNLVELNSCLVQGYIILPDGKKVSFAEGEYEVKKYSDTQILSIRNDNIICEVTYHVADNNIQSIFLQSDQWNIENSQLAQPYDPIAFPQFAKIKTTAGLVNIIIRQ